eukprot:TRINITY_DN65818_c0_g1_i1.p1 TRINITY_DN65818_c0_g1~~TRINITY_DN65818_c0_g1_i1.p1  ORF type:complete len:570 (-),score=134.96 TRINITY_DN65818_c0_g1_i1:108-1817(-)
MELAKLLSPTGELGKVWLAAHWDKRLKKQDYLDVDLKDVVLSLNAKRLLISLRTTGHLLVGACKIYAQKCMLFEEEAEEVRTRLMMAFVRDAEGGVKVAEGEDQLHRQLVPMAMRQVNPEITGGALDDAALLGGKRHVAKLEDITMRETGTGSSSTQMQDDDLFGSMTAAELEAALKELKEKVFIPGRAGHQDLDLVPLPGPLEGGSEFDQLPLVSLSDLPEEATAERIPLDDLGVALEDDLDLDLPALEDDEMPAAGHTSPLVELPAEDQDAAQGVVAPTAAGGGGGGSEVVSARKRSRKNFMLLWDDSIEIPRETYQGYMNDRSSITQLSKNVLDYTILLPHNFSSLPGFTTSYTDMCDVLCEGMQWGTEVTEKRRRISLERSLDKDYGTGGGPPLPTSINGPASPFSPLLSGPNTPAALTPRTPGAGSGLRTPTLAGFPPAPTTPGAGISFSAPVLVSEKTLLENAPNSLSGVVSGQDEDEKEARVGYSARTEKMHSYLAKEFKDTGTNSLSYQALCRAPSSASRREIASSCFFELLVLKTNGVIGIQQDQPTDDIQISKAGLWAK